jgi:hypothetical protein
LSFVGVIGVVMAPTLAFTIWALPFLRAAAQLYLRQQFWSATAHERIASAALFIIWTGLLVVAETIVEVAFRLARRHVVSDQHFVDEVRRVLVPRLTKKWAVGLLALGLLTIALNLISASLQAPTSTSLGGIGRFDGPAPPAQGAGL